MELKKAIYPIGRIILYWCVAMFFAALVVTIFSAFIPMEKLYNYFEYGISSRSLRYAKLTLQFYVFVSFIMAAPGFVLNMAIYLLRWKVKAMRSNKIISIIINIIIAGVVLYFYHRLNISRPQDVAWIILPVYIISIVVWGWVILPAKYHHEPSHDNTIDTHGVL